MDLVENNAMKSPWKGVASEKESDEEVVNLTRKRKISKRQIFDDDSGEENALSNDDLISGTLDSEEANKWSYNLKHKSEGEITNLNEDKVVDSLKDSKVHNVDSDEADSMTVIPIKKIIDNLNSSEDSEVSVRLKSAEGDTTKLRKKLKKKRKIIKGLDSSGESDDNSKKCDSPSSDVESYQSNSIPNSKKKSSKALDSSDDSDGSSIQNKSVHSGDDSSTEKIRKMQKKKSVRSSSSSSSGESENDQRPHDHITAEPLFDMEVDASYTDGMDKEGKSKSGKKGPQRKSKLNALEEIHSETQRLVRESYVSLPYHKPKQRTLADFLNRRKSVAGVSLRTPVTEMTKVWKQIEEREKEAAIFYKSESEEDEGKDKVSIEEEKKKNKVPMEEEENENHKVSIEEEEEKVKDKVCNKEGENGKVSIEEEINKVSVEEENGSIGEEGEKMSNEEENQKVFNEEEKEKPVEESIILDNLEAASNTGRAPNEDIANESVVLTDLTHSTSNHLKYNEHLNPTLDSIPENNYKQNSFQDSDNTFSLRLGTEDLQELVAEKDELSTSIAEVRGSLINANNDISSYEFFSIMSDPRNVESNQSVKGSINENESGNKHLKQSSQDTEVENSFFDISLTKIPRLSGQPNEVIDLEETTVKTGAFGLMKRFMKHAALKPKHKEEKKVDMSIVTSELNDKGEIVSVMEETVSIKSGEKAPKPGEKLVALKATLQQQMATIREQQLAKKKEEFNLYEKEMFDGEKEFCDDLPNEEEEFDVNETESESSSDEEDGDVLDTKDDEEEDEEERKKICLFADNEAEESDDDLEETSTKLSDICKQETVTDLLGDDTDEADTDEISESESVPQVKPQFKIPTLPDTQIDETVGDSLLSLCSGKFTTQRSFQMDDLENSPEKSLSQASPDETLLDLCSGKFPSQSIKPIDLESSQEKFPSNLQSSFMEEINGQDNNKDVSFGSAAADSEDDDDDFGIKSIKSKKRFRKLNFSDDEDEDGNESEKQESDKEETSEKGEEDSEKEVEDIYEENEFEDDEETELARKLSKGFLDGEAELSESDWDSADEDERDLDKFEAEEGDADKINERKLQKELGKIHMKEIMAEDKREIRLLQELLLEDGDLHSDGPKRQRLYRWSNQDNDDLKFRNNDNDENDENEIVDEDEETWRLQRIQRENFLKQKKIDNLKLIESEVNININKSTSIKLTPRLKVTSTKSPDPKKKFALLTNRGSFLKRSDKLLSKLAELSTGSKENPIGNSRGKRMVFAVVSPPKQIPTEETENNNDSLKRKAENLSASVKKKIKFMAEEKVINKMSVFEQLKQVD